MRTSLRRVLLGALIVMIASWSLQNVAQEVRSNSPRKIVSKSEVDYPPLARNLNLTGKVKVVAVVAPDGSVVRCEIVGGSPTFIPTVVNTVKKWKWLAGPRETRELIEISFRPN